MRMTAVCVGIALATFATSPGWSQQNPVGAGLREAPVGHRQPTIRDLPPDVARDQAPPADRASPADVGERQPESVPVRGRSAARTGGPPTLQVGPSCEAAGRGSVVLGRDKKACLADETTAQDTLKQNWSKYAAADKAQCVGMASTGGPASYVELLSCLEIMRDARNIQNTDPLESDAAPTTTRPGRENTRPARMRRRHPA
jgi:hypothetical protein